MYTDDRKFGWITAECPKLASKLRQLMYNDVGYISGKQ